MEPTEGLQTSIQGASLEAVQAKLEEFQTPEIVYDEKSATITYKGLHLTADNPTTSKVTVVVEKQPLKIEIGKTYDIGLMVVDEESDKMKGLAAEAEALKQVPEKERPRAVLELLRKNVHYAYADVMAVVTRDNPELAKWVSENTGLDAPQRKVNLSDVFEKGYGICRHLSVAYLYLAQKAGLEGTLMASGPESIRNIQRTDKEGKLFQSNEVGELAGGHSWNEIRLSDGSWVPVDPSTQLVGDTEEGLRMFKDANYKALSGLGMDREASPSEAVTPQGEQALFEPGEAAAKGTYWLLLKSTKPTVRFGKDNIPPTNIPYQGDAELKIRITPGRRVLNLSMKDAFPSVAG